MAVGFPELLIERDRVTKAGDGLAVAALGEVEIAKQEVQTRLLWLELKGTVKVRTSLSIPVLLPAQRSEETECFDHVRAGSKESSVVGLRLIERTVLVEGEGFIKQGVHELLVSNPSRDVESWSHAGLVDRSSVVNLGVSLPAQCLESRLEHSSHHRPFWPNWSILWPPLR